MRRLRYTNPSGVEIILSDAFYGITSAVGLGVPQMTIQEKKAPYQDGSTHIDQLFEPREIVVDGSISTGVLIDIYRYRREMSAAFNPKLGPGTLIYENDNGSWLLEGVTPQGPIFANKNANEGSQKWQITFHCYDPYWKNVNTKEYSLSGEGTLSMTNAGDVPCPIDLVIYGPITNPKVINNTTGEYIQLIKTFSATEIAIISTRFGAKTISILAGEVPLIQFDNYEIIVNGQALSTRALTNGMQYLNLLSTFFTLDVGANELELIDAGTNTGMSMTVSYRERFVGV